MVESRGLGRRLWLLTALSRAKSLTKPHSRLGLARPKQARLPALGRARHITTNNKRANLDQSTCLTGEGLRATHLDIKYLTVE
jgi:hypothetical protein